MRRSKLTTSLHDQDCTGLFAGGPICTQALHFQTSRLTMLLSLNFFSHLDAHHLD